VMRSAIGFCTKADYQSSPFCVSEYSFQKMATRAQKNWHSVRRCLWVRNLRRASECLNRKYLHHTLNTVFFMESKTLRKSVFMAARITVVATRR
jgi:hypothetical protein